MMTTRRRVLAAGLGLLCLAGTAGFAAYLESQPSDPVREHPPVIVPPPRPAPEHAVQRLVRHVRPGSPVHYGALTIYPLIATRSNHSGVRTLDEALSRGWISISERKDARVEELLVYNKSRHAVFLMAGEILTGGKQNRIIRKDTLLDGHSGPIAVPVYCGEQDRWSKPQPVFKSGKSMAAPGLRKMAAESGAQDAIWRGIDSRMAEARVSSRTRNYQAMYEDQRVRRELDECIVHFRRLRRSGTVGLVAVSGRRIIGCDLFSDPELLSRLWDKICRSYAVSTFGSAPVTRRDRRHGRPSHDISGFLNGIFSSHISHDATPAAGDAVRIGGAVQGHALSWRSEVVHAVLFPGGVPLKRDIDVPRPRIRRGGDDDLWGTE